MEFNDIVLPTLPKLNNKVLPLNLFLVFQQM